MKITFKAAIYRILNEGQELSQSEKMLARNEIQQFEDDYLHATGELPKALFGTILLIAPRLENYGFKIPRADRWRKEIMQDLKEFEEGREILVSQHKEYFG